ncbi:hypothetical protein D3C87_1920920 [compost metagenome]
MVVGKQEFDGRKSRRRCRLEAIEKRYFVEHHREIGSKTGHRSGLRNTGEIDIGDTSNQPGDGGIVIPTHAGR